VFKVESLVQSLVRTTFSAVYALHGDLPLNFFASKFMSTITITSINISPVLRVIRRLLKIGHFSSAPPSGRRWVVSDALVGRMAIERWIFVFCNFQLRACKKLLPPQQSSAPSPDVLIASRASFYSAAMCTKLLPIGRVWQAMVCGRCYIMFTSEWTLLCKKS
jgi:hypothetical protein